MFPILLAAQTPQGINYQAVAYDANGFEFANQEINIRLGILLETAAAESSYTETHQVSTNDFGLFSLVISEGITTDDYSALNWENGAFLKVELDANLDGDYTLMGVSSFNAVPYALYAESSGTPGPQGDPADPMDYDSLATIIRSDSLFTANFLVSSVSGGCNPDYPEGIGEALTLSISENGSFTVPDGKRYYIFKQNSNPNGNDYFKINGIVLSNSSSNGLICANPGDILSAQYGNIALNGFLVNVQPGIEALTLSINENGTYTVPNGKRYYIFKHNSNPAGNDYFKINGVILSYSFSNGLICANSGDILSAQYGTIALNGYLADEDYFTNCGKGLSPNEMSSIDSIMVADMIVDSSGWNSDSSQQDTVEYTSFTKINATENDSTLIFAIPNKSIIMSGSISSCYPEEQTINIIFESEEYNKLNDIKGGGWIMTIENGSSINPYNLFYPLDNLPSTYSGFTRKFYYEFEVSHPMVITIYTTNSCGSSNYLIQY